MAPSRPLKIVCASSLAGGREAFSTLGEVMVVPESDITNRLIRDADILATRSKVKVNDSLLEGSTVSFYGTATAGFDHVDVAALERRGIAWSQAPGSNANSVAEYVLAGLAWLGLERGIDWSGKTLAVIGAGHVGSRLAALAEPFGLKVQLNDPPLADATGDRQRYRPLEEVLAGADIVSLHVPLTDEGPHPTRGMAKAGFFALLKPGAVFINSSRGEVVGESALRQALSTGRVATALLDVFDHEPDIDPVLLDLAVLATPHIAGYSLDGRWQGTEMIYRAACKHFGHAPAWRIPAVEHPAVMTTDRPSPVAEHRQLYEVILRAYSPRVDDQRLRAKPEGVSMARHFSLLRQTYPERREFRSYAVDAAGASSAWVERIMRLGFVVY
jgi:erythronate-4-phosphate dehydrogenase